MGAAIEIDSFKYVDIENAFKRATAKAKSDTSEYDRSYAERGLHLARERHPKMMKGLERCAEILEAERERQIGQTQRSTSTYSYSKAPMEVQAFREAYKAADRGQPVVQLMWLYGAVADLVGLL